MTLAGPAGAVSAQQTIAGPTGARHRVGPLLVGAVVLLAGLVSVGVRSSVDAHRAAARLAAARARGDGVQEIIELGRMIRALPVDRTPALDASHQLEAAARAAEGSGDLSRAREAWRELRSAWFSVRGLGDPGATFIAEAESELTRLGAAREASIQPRLARPGPSIVAVLALLVWVGSAFGLIQHGVEPSGRIAVRAAAPWLVGLTLGLAAWAAAMLAA